MSRNQVRDGSKSNRGGGEPFCSIARKILGRPVSRPSARSSASRRRRRCRAPVRLRFARRRPDHQDAAARHRFRRQERLVRGVEPVAVAAEPLLRRFDRAVRQPGRRQRGAPVPFGDADHDVPAVEVVVVVRERAERLQDLPPGRARVPPGLELDARRLDAARPEQVVDVDRQDGVHAVPFQSTKPIAVSKRRTGMPATRPRRAGAGRRAGFRRGGSSAAPRACRCGRWR